MGINWGEARLIGMKWCEGWLLFGKGAGKGMGVDALVA